MYDIAELALRMSAATITCALIGLNRELHDKPAGMRTHALVGIGAALAVVLVVPPGHDAEPHVDALSRVVQGVLTGIGFLGGGVILRDTLQRRVHGLTTAATVWLAALFGVACGAGAYIPVAMALVLAFVVLRIGKMIEKRLHRRGHAVAPTADALDATDESDARGKGDD